MRLVLLGPPGAGKGTQARILAEAMALAHVATGDLFRLHQARGTVLGKEAASYMERGELVPNRVTIAMLLERIQEPDCAKGFLLDGFPRNLEQARALDDALAKRGWVIDGAVYMKVPEEKLVRRLSERLVCSQCQAAYHTESAPPTVEGRCDKCGGKLYQRKDDSPDAVRRRLQVYMEQTYPLLDYYRTLGKLLEVNGEPPIEEVTQEMKRVLDRVGLASAKGRGVK